MKLVKIIAIVLMVAFVGIQFIPTTRNQSDSVPSTDFMLVNNVPETIQKKLQESCYDCHSNNTKYPWYNRIQPFGWLLENHIKEGKEKLNFSDFGSYSKRRQKSKLKSIADQIEDGKMPLSSYSMVHQDAMLSEDEKKEVLDWVDTMINNLNEN